MSCMSTCDYRKTISKLGGNIGKKVLDVKINFKIKQMPGNRKKSLEK